MEDDEAQKALSFILGHLQRKGLRWRLGGSFNLRVQGVEVTPRDLDIVTDEAGLKRFSRALGKCCLEDVRYVKGKGSVLKCTVEGIEVEVWSYEGPLMLDKVVPARWRGLAVNLLPLPQARRAYARAKRPDRVKLIDKALS